MAVVNCKECGNQVSTKAKNCPSCGATAPKRTSLLTWLVLILIVFYAVGAFMTPDTPTSPSATNASTAPAARTSSPTRQTPEKPSWDNFTSNDEMTGKKSAYATSPRVASKSPMEFPYNGTKAWIGIGCSSSGEWAYIGFTGAPNLNNTDTEDGYNVITTRVRWDDAVQNTKFLQKWGDVSLQFQSGASAIAKLAGSKNVMLELDWHGQRPVYFEFSLEDSSDAIKSMRANCR